MPVPILPPRLLIAVVVGVALTVGVFTVLLSALETCKHGNLSRGMQAYGATLQSTAGRACDFAAPAWQARGEDVAFHTSVMLVWHGVSFVECGRL
jgi:hypothetical protein